MATAQKKEPSLKRAEVGKRVRAAADAIRRSLVDVVEGAADPDVEDYQEAFKRLKEDFKQAETALKEWDNLSPLEDSCEELEWRQRVYSMTTYLVKEFKETLNARMPENRMVAALEIRSKLLNKSQTTEEYSVTPEIRQLLTEIEDKSIRTVQRDGTAKKYPTFLWSFLRYGCSLSLNWLGVFNVTLKFSKQREVVQIRVLADREDSWPSSFDIFRELERQARIALRDFSMSADDATSFDDITLKLISWFNDRTDLFQAKCALSNRYLALSAVGDRGQLEARPPMARSKTEGDGKTLLQASYSSENGWE